MDGQETLLSPESLERDAALTSCGGTAPSEPDGKGKILRRCFKPHCPGQSRKPADGRTRTPCTVQADGFFKSLASERQRSCTTGSSPQKHSHEAPKMLPVGHTIHLTPEK